MRRVVTTFTLFNIHIYPNYYNDRRATIYICILVLLPLCCKILVNVVTRRIIKSVNYLRAQYGKSVELLDRRCQILRRWLKTETPANISLGFFLYRRICAVAGSADWWDWRLLRPWLVRIGADRRQGVVNSSPMAPDRENWISDSAILVEDRSSLQAVNSVVAAQNTRCCHFLPAYFTIRQCR